MYSITFNSQCQAVLGKLTQDKQLQLVDFLSNFDAQKVPAADQIKRDNKLFYRLKWEAFRIYIESTPKGTLIVHSILSKHSWNDFLFRAKLPYPSENNTPK